MQVPLHSLLSPTKSHMTTCSQVALGQGKVPKDHGRWFLHWQSHGTSPSNSCCCHMPEAPAQPCMGEMFPSKGALPSRPNYRCS